MPEPPEVHDVVIAGGSFVGLALALALARAGKGGVDVAIVDRIAIGRDVGAVAPSDPRAFALSAGSRNVLEAIGVWSAVEVYAEPVTRIEITDSSLRDSVRPVLLRYETVVDGHPQMLILPADRLREALTAAVLAEPLVHCRAPASVVDLASGPGTRALALADGSQVAGRLVVAADGARSQVRSHAAIGIVGSSHGQHGIAAIVGHRLDHGGCAVQHFLPAGPFALLPLRGRRSCITWSEAESSAARIMALGDNDFLAEAQQRAGWRLGELSLEGPRASWPLGSHLARSLIGARLALVGDAARSVHPIAGQGLNLGLRDVAALTEVIIAGLRLGLEAGDATILERYERWRRSDGVQSAAAFTALNSLFSNDSALLRLTRDTGLGIVDRLPGLKQWLVAEAAGLTGDVPRLLKGEPL